MKHTFCFLVLVFYADVADASCKVADFHVQENFDLKKYTGVTWYELKLLPVSNIPLEDLYQDYQHTYYLHPNGSTLTIFINGRDPKDPSKCHYYTQELKTTDAAGKLLSKMRNGTHAYYLDYWIMSTDYTSYSVVYRCEEQDSTGDCIFPNAWIYSRTPQLSSDKMAIAESVLDTLCVNKSSMLVTLHSNGECPLDKNCTIYTIESKRMQNFDFDGLVGAWYRFSMFPEPHTPVNNIYHDYRYDFDLDSNKKLFTVFTRARNPEDIENCTYSVGQLLATAENGKFLYRRFSHSHILLTSDFWVMHTDNVKYAIVYGCRQINISGLCNDPHAYILSRGTSIPDDTKALVDSKIHELCLDSSGFLPTVHNNDCSDTRSCNVTSIIQRMVQGFDHEKALGTWYRYSYLSPTPQRKFTDYQKIVMGSTGESESQLSITKTRARYPGTYNSCEYEDLKVRTTDQPGKEITIYKTPTGDKEVTSYVMAINYSSYLVEYSCEEQERFMCSKPSVSIWSRGPDLSPEHLAVANQVIIGLCLNYDTFTKVDQSNPCPDQIPNKSSAMSNDYLLILIIMFMAANYKDASL